jgi:DNA-binding NtrC family response regulator
MKASAGRILYVEDDEDTRELVTWVLAMNNYRIVAAENCDDALMARSNEFDLGSRSRCHEKQGCFNHRRQPELCC